MAKKRDIDLSATMESAAGMIEEAKNRAIERPARQITRNVHMSEQTYWQLEAVRTKLSASGNKKTQSDIINEALTDYLNRNYPETLDAYRLIHGK